MLVKAAVNATQGPVATEFPQSRAATVVAGHSESARTEPVKSESARTAESKAENKAGDGKSEKTVPGAVINPTFRYDAQAQRMVMLMRDEKSGTVIVQVPSEVALRQYEQAVKRAQEDVAATQHAQAGQSAAVSQTSSIEAAALGVLVPFGSAALSEGSKPAAQAEAKALPAGTAGSVTAGGNARFNIVV